MDDVRSLSVEQLEERLGGNVRATRLARDLTQRELADRANVSLGAVRSLENGRGSTLTTLVKVVRALGQPAWIDDLRPPARAFNPLDLLEEREQQRRRRPVERQRVGRRRAPEHPG